MLNKNIEKEEENNKKLQYKLQIQKKIHLQKLVGH